MAEINSQKQILKSTGIIGSAQIFSILIGIVRTKVIAILLGPSGVGIIGILQATVDLVRSATGFGINFSGVKDVAEANSYGDNQRIARTITILRRWALGTGILGMFITIALCVPLSNFSFGNDSYTFSIALISVTLSITSISGAQLALLQGMRLIKQMAKATLLGAILGLFISLPLYWWLEIKGIVPGMVLNAIGGLVVSWWFAHKIKIERSKLSLSLTIRGGLKMARLGFFIVATGFIATATIYATRAYITDKLNIDAVGYFQAAWTISNLYLSIVLNAMLADFFPRLSEIHNDNITSNRLINEQMEIALLVGSPLIILLIAFSNFVIRILYSSSFSLAISVLQWQMGGAFIVLIAWPLGVMFLAKNKGHFSLITDGIWSVVYLFCIYFGWNHFGFSILGIAYSVACFIKLIAVFITTKYLGDFSFSRTNIKYISIFGVSTILMILNVFSKTGLVQYIISAIINISIVAYSYNRLNKIINLNRLFSSKILGR